MAVQTVSSEKVVGGNSETLAVDTDNNLDIKQYFDEGISVYSGGENVDYNTSLYSDVNSFYEYGVYET